MFRSLALFALACAATACTHDVDADAAAVVVVDGEDVAAVTYVEPGEVDSTRLYLGVHNPASLDEEIPLFYGHFDMLPKGKVNITVSRQDGSVDDAIGFKVYRVNPRGTLRYLGQVSGDGSVTVRLESRAGGTFVVEATSPLNEYGTAQLGIDIVCKRRDGLCAPLGQPGDFCGGRGGHPCDTGLFCQIDVDCGRSDHGGVCAIPSQICPAVACREVCGCDGVTYCDACDAHSVSANVDYAGACEVAEEPVCDPAVYTKTENVNTHGIWTAKGENGDYDIFATLGLHDGDFSYTQVWDPKCLHIAPFCRRASLVFSMTGGWLNQGNNVQLLPDPESTPAPEQLAQSFGVQTNCEGDLRLVTTELGDERVFSRDLCADFQCNEEEGFHCEVQPVQCLVAPCPLQPTCVQ